MLVLKASYLSGSAAVALPRQSHGNYLGWKCISRHLVRILLGWDKMNFHAMMTKVGWREFTIQSSSLKRNWGNQLHTQHTHTHNTHTHTHTSNFHFYMKPSPDVHILHEQLRYTMIRKKTLKVIALRTYSDIHLSPIVSKKKLCTIPQVRREYQIL